MDDDIASLFGDGTIVNEADLGCLITGSEEAFLPGYIENVVTEVQARLEAVAGSDLAFAESARQALSEDPFINEGSKWFLEQSESENVRVRSAIGYHQILEAVAYASSLCDTTNRSDGEYYLRDFLARYQELHEIPLADILAVSSVLLYRSAARYQSLSRREKLDGKEKSDYLVSLHSKAKTHFFLNKMADELDAQDENNS